MSRIPLITSTDDLDPDGRPAHDRIVESRGELLRPFQVLLHAPHAARQVADLGHVLRFASHLADADRELVTLATGRATRCAYVWASHLGAAIAAGVPAAAIAAVEEGRPAPGEHEAALLAFVDELCHSGTVSDRTFGAVHELLGTPATVELMLVVGYYTMLSYVMNGAGAC